LPSESPNTTGRPGLQTHLLAAPFDELHRPWHLHVIPPCPVLVLQTSQGRSFCISLPRHLRPPSHPPFSQHTILVILQPSLTRHRPRLVHHRPRLLVSPIQTLWGRAAPNQPSAAKIPSFSTNSRRPANIPLHTLRPSHPEQATESEKQSLRRSSDSDFSSWSDTGDIGDQLAAEDPLGIRLEAALEETAPGAQSKRLKKKSKKVHYASSTSSRHDDEKRVVKRKEDIPIPEPPSRRLNLGERLLVAIMAPNDGPSRIHGLHGKKLIYFTTVFVSLGVFLFVYDQCVMSGIIT